MISIVFMWLIRYTLYTPSLSLSLSLYLCLSISIYQHIYIYSSIYLPPRPSLYLNPSNLIPYPSIATHKKKIVTHPTQILQATNYVHTHHNKLDMCVPSPRLAPKTTFFQRDKNFYDLDIFINEAN